MPNLKETILALFPKINIELMDPSLLNTICEFMYYIIEKNNRRRFDDPEARQFRLRCLFLSAEKKYGWPF